MMTLKELENTLREITESVPSNGSFLENSCEREIAYSIKSSYRWLDIIRIIENLNLGGKCLDIGTSPFTFALKSRFNDMETLDYTNAFRDRCTLTGIKLHVGGDNWEINTMLPDDYYDCIIFLEVIEHMHMNPEKILLFLKKKLRNGGHLIMSTPNMMCVGNRINMLFNKKLFCFTYPAFAENEHQIHGHRHDRVFMPAEMKEYLDNTNWKSYNINYHSMKVADDGMSGFKRLLRLPIRFLKYVVPSMRQIMVITAMK
ncbi:MAG: methyltransferase domain-containing protein [Bacteroidota bacterium]